ncbi:MAG: TonB-dependent receptor [Ferruginibacter sp.]|nr:TonB-dependent receptor [Ferruginibacter sp.]
MKMTNRLRHLLLFALSLLFFSSSWAQDRKVSGTVTDYQNQPLPNVSVSVKGKLITVTTDVNGIFTIDASLKDVLVFSSVGFESLESKVVVGDMTIKLSTAIGNLNEVVVVGYGTARKKDLTGAVTTVTSKDFQKGVITTPEQLISGKVAGVSIISNGGRPGSGSTILIRGGASLSASNTPLFVIDGVPVDNATISGGSNPLAFLNPNDIESFTVLKDASSAAIYGTRASNGVIIITTKKGKGGGLRVNFSAINSIANITKKVPVLTGDQIRSIVNTDGTAAQKAQVGTANTDWQEQIYQAAFATDNNISFSGGLKKLPYRVSLGFANQQGVLLTDKVQRFSAGIALNPTFFDNHLKVDINIKGSSQNNRFATNNAIGAAVSFDPSQPVYATVKAERFGGFYEWLDPATPTGLLNLAGRNPLGQLLQRRDKSTPQRSIGNVQLDYKFHFLPELRANINLGYDVSRGEGTIYVSDSAATGYLAGGLGGSNNYYQQKRNNKVFEFYLAYAKEVKSIKGRFDVLAGYSYNNFLTTVYNYPTYNARGVKNAGSDPTFAIDRPENTLISFFGRTNLSIKDKYLITATLRRDGSSRFAPDNRWGLFPSLAVAWNLKNESFLKQPNWLSALKLRGSYGVTGQQDGIGNYDYLSYYALSTEAAQYQFGDAFIQAFRPGGFYADRKWEETSTFNLALDFGFINDRVSGSIDVYYKKTKDLLNNVAQPAGTNFTAFIVANVGDMENKGVEFTINTQAIKKKDFTLDLNYNITYNQNKITNLTVVPKDANYPGVATGGISGGVGGGFSQINAVGFSRNTFNLYKQLYDQTTGMPIEGFFSDENRDGIINQNDLVKNKSAIPKIFMGFSSNATYKKWSAGFVLRASFGNYVYNNVISQLGTRSQILGNSVIYNGSPEYLKTGFQGGGLQLLSDYYITNASFLRMDNFNLGYDLGRVYHDKVAVRLNASVQNVFVITKYKGLDPEISSGVDNNIYPRPRLFALGVNLDF